MTFYMYFYFKNRCLKNFLVNFSFEVFRNFFSCLFVDLGRVKLKKNYFSQYLKINKFQRTVVILSTFRFLRPVFSQ
jgi:hypothetical protein